MERVDNGDQAAAKTLRILTPLIKFRACRDNIAVATASMEVRGGNGFIEDWVNPRLVRDAHTGVLWEGTSSIVALDVTTRAVAKNRAHEALAEALHDLMDDADDIPGQFRGELSAVVDKASAFADEVAADPENEPYARQATNALYHAMTAVLLAREGALIAAETGDARRTLLARLVIDHRLNARDPMSIADKPVEKLAAELLLGDAPASLADVDTVLHA
jgi:hypothetical protein